MTDSKAFYCPHGVDVTPRLRFVQNGDVQKSIYDQTECLKCTADHGHIVLFNHQFEAAR